MSEQSPQNHSEKGVIYGKNAQQKNDLSRNDINVSPQVNIHFHGSDKTSVLPDSHEQITKNTNENNVVIASEQHDAGKQIFSEQKREQTIHLPKNHVKRLSSSKIRIYFQKYYFLKILFSIAAISIILVSSIWLHPAGNIVIGPPIEHFTPTPPLVSTPTLVPTLTPTPLLVSTPTLVPTLTPTPTMLGVSRTPQDIYNQYISGSPSEEDATLNGSVWSWTTAFGDCQFTNGQYHAIQSNAGSYTGCIASSAGDVTNIAIQAQVVINKGDTAGLIFGFQSSSSYYEFGFCINSSCVPGTVSLWQITAPTHSHCVWPNPQSGCNQIFSCVHTNLGDKNVLTAILLNNTVYLYMNGQSVSPALTSFDSISGEFGVAVFDNRNLTDATFTNVKIWHLSS